MTTKNSAQAPINFTLFFKEEKDIYIQNLSNGQVSLQFGRGDDAMGFTLIRKQDPINLTNHIPFKKVAESTEFRKMLSRRPAIIRLLTEDEYNKYYADKSKREKKAPEDLIQEAESKRAGYKDNIAPVKTTAPKDDDEEKVDNGPDTEETIISPRVIHLCHQAISKEIPENERMKLPALLQELKDIESELTFDDLEYIRAHVGAKSIATWVTQRQKAITEANAKAS